MKIFTQIIFLIIISALTACSSIETQNEYTRQFDFASIMTYKISKESGSLYYDEIKEAVNTAMAHKGMGINVENYDFIIDWNLQSDGSLNIEIYNPRTMDIVWRGWTKEIVTEASIPDAVQTIFKDFPPAAIAVFP